MTAIIDLIELINKLSNQSSECVKNLDVTQKIVMDQKKEIKELKEEIEKSKLT